MIKKMKAWKAYTIYLLTVFLVSGLALLANLAPAGHFQAGQVPATASNGKQSVGTASDGNPYERKPAGRNSINLLLLGTDARKQEISRTDLIMLAHISLQTQKMILVSVPRDTRVETAGVGFTKINHAHMIGETKGGNHAGTEAALQAVSQFLRCEIHYYLKIDLKGFKNIVDTIGGVDIELPKPVKLTFSRTQLPAGIQHIDGDLALQFVKERYSLPTGDFGRQKHHRLLLEAILHKLSQPRHVIEWPVLLSQAAKDVLDTNLSMEVVFGLAWHIKGIAGEDIIHLQVPGKSSYSWDPLVKAPVYYWIPDEEQVREITAQLTDPGDPAE